MRACTLRSRIVDAVWGNDLRESFLVGCVRGCGEGLGYGIRFNERAIRFYEKLGFRLKSLTLEA